MKAILLGALLSVAMPLTHGPATPSATAVPNFSGAWVLDTARSQGLPPYYHTRIKSHRLAVTQSDSALVVDVTVDAVEAAPDRFHLVYRLDGAETPSTMKVRTPQGPIDVPARLAAKPAPDGGLHITITREVPRPDGGTTTAVGTEDWSLGPDGRTLTVHRTEQMPQGGEMHFVMVFART